MTDAEFMDAVCSLGVELVPPPAPGQDAQYQATEDPRRSERSSVTLQEGLILAEWADCKRVLEIGTGLGISTVCLADTAIEVVTVDPDEWVHRSLTLPPNVVRLSSIDQVEGEFDMAFIDGLHDIESVRQDIVRCLGFVRPGGTIAFHDVCQSEVSSAVGEVPWSSRETCATVGHLTLCGVPA